MDRIIQADRIAFSHGAGFANGMLADARLNADRLRGRGAAVNPAPRFDRYQRESFDDGWQAFEELPPFATEVQIDKSRTVISKNDSPDLPFDQSVNPYRGCEHGCVYCFARPTHAYLGLSPGLEFETKLFAKPDAARLLEREIAKPNYEVKTLAIGTNTDPYQPVEKKYRIMREILEVLGRGLASGDDCHQVGSGDARHRHPVAHGRARAGEGGGVGDDDGPGAWRGRWSRAPRQRRGGWRRCGR